MSNTLLAEIAEKFADNDFGDITPLKLRSVLNEFVSKIEELENSVGTGSGGSGAVRGPEGPKGDTGPQGLPGNTPDISQFVQISTRNQALGYAGLDANSKIPATYLPTIGSRPHQVFSSEAEMLAAKDSILTGDLVLVHGDPDPTHNGEYVALQDKPDQISGYDHMGEHVAVHRHDAADVDIAMPFGPKESLQDMVVSWYHAEDLPNRSLSCADLRILNIGVTYKFHTEDRETSPGSGINVPVSQTEHAGIFHKGHQLVNAVMLRTGIQTWMVCAEEFSGSTKQPTVIWELDLDPLWPNHTAVGDIEARSFTSIVNDLFHELGDTTVFGSDTLVDKMQELEKDDNELSKRVATLEGGAAHKHVDVAPEFKLHINNQGLHYMIVNDRSTDLDHVGTDLFDGKEHKITFVWDNSKLPFSKDRPFDPSHVMDKGDSVNWVTGTKPNVWIQKTKPKNEFKQFQDPLSGTIFAFAAIKQFVDLQSVVTVKWDNTKGVVQILKVQAPTVHTVTTPDHQPLQVGGQVDAKSLPLVSLNAEQIKKVKSNSFYLDDSQKLMWKDNAGVAKEVAFKP